MLEKPNAIAPIPERLYPTRALWWLVNCVDLNQKKAGKKLSVLTKNWVKENTVDRMMRRDGSSFASGNFFRLTEVFNGLLEKDADFRTRARELIKSPSVIWKDLGSETPETSAVAKKADAGRAKNVNAPFFVESPVSDFVERAEFREIYSELSKAKSWRLLLVGNGGCGKTELARKLASDFRKKFADGIVELDFSHSETPTGLLRVLRPLFKRFFPDENPLKLSSEELFRDLRQRLRGRKILFIFDGARLEETVNAILPAPPCSAIITTRNNLKIPGFKSFHVTPMKASDAEKLVVNIFGEGEIDFSESWELGRFAGFNPFALRGVAKEVAKRKSRRTEEILELILKKGPSIFDHLKLVRESYKLLNRDEQRVWEALSVFPEHFNRQHVKAILSACIVEEKLDEIFDLLENTSRISPYAIVDEYSHAIPPSSALNPGGNNRFMLEPLEKKFLKQEFRKCADAEPIERQHSFYFRERFLLWKIVSGIDSRKQGMERQIHMDYENIHGALAWSILNSAEIERDKFQAFLKAKGAVEMINAYFGLKNRYSMSDLLLSDNRACKKLPDHWSMNIYDLP